MKKAGRLAMIVLIVGISSCAPAREMAKGAAAALANPSAPIDYGNSLWYAIGTIIVTVATGLVLHRKIDANRNGIPDDEEKS